MKYLGISLLILVLFASCGKHLPDLPNESFDYSVTGVADVKVPANSSDWLGAQINVIKGNPENEPISITYENLPPNVFLGKSSATFRANYRFIDSIGVRNGVKGTYPITAVFSSKTTGVRKYNFNLIITDSVDRAKQFTGNYKPSGDCGFSKYVSCSISRVAGTWGDLRIVDRHTDNFYNYGTFDTTYAIVDCCSDSFEIPTQKVNGTIVEGRGYKLVQWDNRFAIERHFSNDSLDYYCTVTLDD